MHITKKIALWNETLTQANIKVKVLANAEIGTCHFQVAKYKDDDSLTSRLAKGINNKTGLDLRFSFINIDKVIHTTEHEENLEKFINDFKFDINKGGFAYQSVTIKEFDAARRSEALDKVMSKELPIKEVPKSPTPGHAVELDSFAKELISEFSKPEHKNKVKIVKSKSLGRGR